MVAVRRSVEGLLAEEVSMHSVQVDVVAVSVVADQVAVTGSSHIAGVAAAGAMAADAGARFTVKTLLASRRGAPAAVSDDRERAVWRTASSSWRSVQSVSQITRHRRRRRWRRRRLQRCGDTAKLPTS